MEKKISKISDGWRITLKTGAISLVVVLLLGSFIHWRKISADTTEAQQTQYVPNETAAFVYKVAPKFEQKYQYVNAVTAASKQSGIPERILVAVTYVESKFNPNVVSSANCKGLFQLMPATAKYMAPKVGLNYYPGIEHSIYDAALIAAGYLAELHKNYVDKGIEKPDEYSFTLRAYNMGPYHPGTKNNSPKQHSYVKKINETLAMLP